MPRTPKWLSWCVLALLSANAIAACGGREGFVDEDEPADATADSAFGDAPLADAVTSADAAIEAAADHTLGDGTQSDAHDDVSGDATGDPFSADGSDADDGAANDADPMDGASEDAGDATLEDATIDAPNDDASNDAPLDALGCSGEGSACKIYGFAGLCKGGTCRLCTPSSDNGACSKAYGDGGGYVCGGASGCDPEGFGCLVYQSCQPGDCVSYADCPTDKPFCNVTHCAACDGPLNDTYYVDPVYGIDSPERGGGHVGGVIASVCAFKTLTYALKMIGSSPPAGTIISVRNWAFAGTLEMSEATGETFPWTIPANTTVYAPRGTYDSVIALVPQGKVGIVLAQPSAVVNGFALDGQTYKALNGIVVNGAADPLTTTIRNVSVYSFKDSGIRVESGGVKLLGPMQVRENGDPAAPTTAGAGLHVTGTGVVRAAIIASNFSSVARVTFNSNRRAGVLVDQRGSVNFLSATALLGIGPLIAAGGNGVAGFEIKQDPSLGPLTPCTFRRVIGNGNTNGAGLLVHGGSLVEVRDSRFLLNSIGVNVQPFGGNTPPAWSNDTNGIFLGGSADAGVEAGANLFQMPLDAGGNQFVGLCVGTNASTPLNAVGNQWAAADGGIVDCRTVNATISKTAACDAGTANIGLGAAQVGTSLRIDQCD